MTLRLTTLGHPSVALHDQEVSSLPGKPVTFGLLVFLALEGKCTRDRLVGVFWPDSAQEKARHALSQTLYELRQILGEEGVESKAEMVRIPEATWVDCLEFEAASEEGRHGEALALYHGPFLDGVYLAQTHPFEEWVERKRARLGRRFRATADAFIRDCRKEDELEPALQVAWKWVGLDPLDDGAQHHLIHLLAETGSRTEALAQFDRYRNHLEAELGLEPLEETLELVASIRDGSLHRGSDQEGGPETSPEEPEGSRLASSWPPPTPYHAEERSITPATAGQASLQSRMEGELAPTLEVLRPIGKGSMSEVYLAREPHLRRLVAVKVLSPDLYSDPRARKRFEREAQAAARINSPHVCTVHRVGTLSDGTPFLVSPFVKGTSLAQRLKAEGPFSTTEVRRVLREVAAALAAAHKLGIVHRDVRPDNVLRSDENGRHSLCDFGIAGVLETGDESEPKLTRTGEILGHPAFISPEQMDGGPLTDRTDIYSLGVMAFQLLTGHPPPPLEERKKGLAKRGAAADPLDDLLGEEDPTLVELIGRCLAPNPAHRPSAADLERKLLETGSNPSPETSGRLHDINLGSLLFRKRLPQILGSYVAAGFLAMEAVDLLQTRGIVPEVLVQATFWTVPFGFLGVTVLGWFHGEAGRQNTTTVEKALYWVLGVSWIGVMGWVVATS